MAEITDKDEPSKRGRKPKWKKSFINSARDYCTERGCTDVELCEHFGVAKSTFYLWRIKYPEFSDAIIEGRKLWQKYGCQDIVRTLYENARGFDFAEQHITQKKRGTAGNLVIIEETKKIVHRHFRPDQKAIEFILVNRLPDEWKPPGAGIEDEDPDRYGVLLLGDMPTEAEWLLESEKMHDDQKLLLDESEKD